MGWSPNSSRVLFASDRNGATGLYGVSIVGGSRQDSATLLKADLGNAAPMGVTTSGALYYHARSGGAARFLQTVECDSSAARCVGAPVTLGAANHIALAWSPDSRHLAYLSPGTSSSESAPTLKIRSADGTIVREVSSTDLPLGGTVNMSWSPDGRVIAVATLRGGRLSVVDVERALVTELSSGLAFSRLEWSADQRQLYYVRDLGRRTGEQDVAFMERDLESGEEREIFRRPSAASLDAWSLSPDRQSVWLVVTDTATRISDLLVVSLTGTERRQVLRRPGIGRVSFSPDGRHLATAYYDAAAQATAVVVVPTGDGEPRELMRATAPADVGLVTWAPDSRSVYFRRRPNGARGVAELWRLAIEGGGAMRIEGADGLAPELPFSLSPDGRQLAVIRGDGGGPVRREVWKLENFLPAASLTFLAAVLFAATSSAQSQAVPPAPAPAFEIAAVHVSAPRAVEALRSCRSMRHAIGACLRPCPESCDESHAS